MIRPRLRGRCLKCGLLASPVLVWALILVLTPTGWVKDRLVARLEAETGRSVRIGSVHLGIFGNLKIDDLSFAERQTPADPWLRVDETRIDVHLGQMLLGRCEPSDVMVDGASLRVWRRGDGRFEFGDLARPSPSVVPGGVSALPTPNLIPAVNIHVSSAKVRFVDDPNQFRADLTDITARGSYKPLAVKVDDLRGQVNGGSLAMAAQLVRDPSSPRFSAEVQGKSIHLDHGLELVEMFVPLVARSDDRIGGTLNVRLALRGQGVSCPEIRKNLTGHGSILLDPIDLDGSKILSELRTLGDWPKTDHVGAVSSNFKVDRGRVSTEDLTIRASKIPLVVAGWTDFDGRFDFAAKVDAIAAGLPREAQGLLGEFRGNLDDLSGLRLRGDRDRVDVTVHGRPLAGDPARPDGERARFREAARRVRDRFFR